MEFPKDSLSIGQLAHEANVGVETLRFYERKGLLAEPPRQGTYRSYPREAVARVRFIRRAKSLGFTLREVAELLDLRIDPDKSCADVRKLARAKLVEVESRLSDLQRIREALEVLAHACRGKGPTTDCPILDALEETLDGDR